ncbi:MAG: hypothetical protein J4F98_00225 [Acidobacteria bacterium]|nr:hypothetical protein [Acidobacteriota bacterium]
MLAAVELRLAEQASVQPEYAHSRELPAGRTHFRVDLWVQFRVAKAA